MAEFDPLRSHTDEAFLFRAGMFNLVAATSIFMANNMNAVVPDNYHDNVNPRSPAEVAQILDEAQTVALRYNCQLTNIETVGPAEPTRDGVPRSQVVLSVNLSNTPESISVLEKYADDDTISWLPPFLGATTETEQGTIPVVSDDPYMQPLPSEPGRIGTLSGVSLYPKNDYPEGAVLDVFVGQAVHTTLSTPDTDYKNPEGIMPCGTIVRQNGEWVLGGPSDIEPYYLDIFNPTAKATPEN